MGTISARQQVLDLDALMCYVWHLVLIKPRSERLLRRPTGVDIFIVNFIVIISVVNSGIAADLLLVYIMAISRPTIVCILREGHG